MPGVLNKRTDIIPLDAIYVGRPSRWGNPFRIGVHGTREEVMEKYMEFMGVRPLFRAIIRQELEGKDLVCWCAPLPCHADILLEIANKEDK